MIQKLKKVVSVFTLLTMLVGIIPINSFASELESESLPEDVVVSDDGKEDTAKENEVVEDMNDESQGGVETISGNTFDMVVASGENGTIHVYSASKDYGVFSGETKKIEVDESEEVKVDVSANEDFMISNYKVIKDDGVVDKVVKNQNLNEFKDNIVVDKNIKVSAEFSKTEQETPKTKMLLGATPSDVGKTVTITEGTKYYFPTGYYETSMNVSNGMTSFCMDYNTTFVSGQAVVHNATEYYSQDTLNWLYAAYVLSANDLRVYQVMVWYYLNGIRSETIMSMFPEAQKLYNLSQSVKNQYIGHGYMYIMNNGSQKNMSIWGEKAGQVKLIKTADDPTGLTTNNSCYSLAGAKYGVYSNASCTSQVGTLTTKENGGSNELSVKAGTYYVKEIQAPKGFWLDTQIYPVTVTSGNTATVNVSDVPQDDPVNIKLHKIDKETGEKITVQDGSLEGAEYTYKFYGSESASGSPLRTWVFRTDENGEIYVDRGNEDEYIVAEKSDEFYRNYAGRITFPVGTITIQETLSPEGYSLDPNIYTYHIVQQNNTAIAVDEDGNVTSKLNIPIESTVEEQIIRCDIEFTKLAEDTDETLGNTQWTITCKETGESHDIMMDENGFWSSASSYRSHLDDTNGGSKTSGTWFGMDSDGNETTPDDKVGAFAHGTYEFKEKQTLANKMYKLQSFEVQVDEHNQLISVGDVVDERYDDITIHTKAHDKNGKKRVYRGKNTIVDTCTLENLIVGRTYRLDGLQMLKEENATLIIDGKEVKGNTEFTATKENMDVDVVFTLDIPEELEGKDIVTFEELYDTSFGEDTLVAEHKDIDDDGQSIYILKHGNLKITRPYGINTGVRTGDKTLTLIFVLVVLMAMSGVVIIRKKQELK